MLFYMSYDLIYGNNENNSYYGNISNTIISLYKNHNNLVLREYSVFSTRNIDYLILRIFTIFKIG